MPSRGARDVGRKKHPGGAFLARSARLYLALSRLSLYQKRHQTVPFRGARDVWRGATFLRTVAQPKDRANGGGEVCPVSPRVKKGTKRCLIVVREMSGVKKHPSGAFLARSARLYLALSRLSPYQKKGTKRCLIVVREMSGVKKHPGGVFLARSARLYLALSRLSPYQKRHQAVPFSIWCERRDLNPYG